MEIIIFFVIFRAHRRCRLQEHIGWPWWLTGYRDRGCAPLAALPPAARHQVSVVPGFSHRFPFMFITNAQELTGARGLTLRRGDVTSHTPRCASLKETTVCAFSAEPTFDSGRRKMMSAPRFFPQPHSTQGGDSSSSWQDRLPSVILTWRKLSLPRYLGAVDAISSGWRSGYGAM